MRNREPFCIAAQQIFLAIERGHCTAFITVNQTTDFHYLMRKEVHNTEDPIKALKSIDKLFHILDSTASDFRRALYSGRSDFEDALEIETAARADLDCIVTRNVKDYEDSSIIVYTPEQFVKQLKK